MLTKKEIDEKVHRAVSSGNWVSPLWEPWIKCDNNEKHSFVLMLNLIKEFAPASLGCIDVRFEKCSPYRSFCNYGSKDDINFLDKIIEKALGKESV